MTDDQKVKLGKTGQITLPVADVREYVGKKTKIKLVEERNGEFGYYIKVITEDLGPLKDVNGKEIMKDKEVIQARGSRIFSLREDSEGNVGWTEDSTLQEFLDNCNVIHYDDLVGVDCVVQGSVKKDKTYLTIL